MARGGKKSGQGKPNAVSSASAKTKSKRSQKKPDVITYRDKKNKNKGRGVESLFGSPRRVLRKGPTDLPLTHPKSSAKKQGARNNPRQFTKTPPRSRSARKFSVCLPKSVPQNPPWKKHACPSSEIQSASCPLLQKVPASNLARLDEELRQFASYVRLNETEMQARSFLVRRLEEMARELFEARRKSTHIRFNKNDEEEDTSGKNDIRMQIFGSFATPSVCMFQSDVDLALWGVVEPAKEEPAKPSPKPQQKSLASAAKKGNSKLLKWKAALQEADKVDEHDDESDSDGPHDLFVIDRMGADAEVAGGSAAADENDTPEQVKPASPDNKTQTTMVDGNPLGRTPMSAAALKRQRKRESKAKSKNVPACAEIIDLASPVVVDLTSPAKTSEGEDEQSKSAAVTEESSEGSNGATCETQKTGGTIAAIGVDANDDGDSDVDSADKLDALRPRAFSLPDAEEAHFVAKRSPSIAKAWEQFEKDATSILSASSCEDGPSDDDEPIDESELTVSFFSDSSPSKPTFGPTGAIRQEVIRALNALSKKIRKPAVGLSKTLTVRKHARVPIINMITPFGYECDIALGGHNGTDTSAYAATQANKYESFSVVVLILKVMLEQNDLDKPFTGGLGSFKLYVLVAHHIERYLSHGGSDRPAEVLLSFLFRYGKVDGHGNVPRNYRTTLSQLQILSSEDGGSADLGAVYQMDNCVSVFGTWWIRLWGILCDRREAKRSLLAHVIDADELDKRRRESQRHANAAKNFIKKETGTMRAQAREEEKSKRKRTAPNNFSDTDEEERSAKKLKAKNQKNTPTKLKHPDDFLDTDEEAAQLEESYNVKRNDSAKKPRSSKKKSKNAKKEARKQEKGNKRGSPGIDAPLGAKRSRPK